MKLSYILVPLVLFCFGLFAHVAVRAIFSRAPVQPPNTFLAGFPEDYSEGEVKAFPDHSVFVRRDNDSFIAFSSLCTHMSCELDWNSQEGTFDCDCHGSRFKSDGKVMNLPAKRPLERYAIYFHERLGLVVDLSRKAKSEQEWSSGDFVYKTQ
ncbi:MAG: hypothetical protein Kow00107_08190 [Planctomycetota bacterium]